MHMYHQQTSQLPRDTWGAASQKSKETRHSPGQSCLTAVRTMVHQGDPQGLGAHTGPPSLRSRLPFHHSEGPGRRKPGHGRGVVWPGRGTQGRTDLGLWGAPRPVTTLEVYKVLGIIVGFWQKAMEPKPRRMAFKEKASLRIHAAPAWGPSEMQTPGHPWRFLPPARARGASWTPGAAWGSSPTLGEGLHPPG